MIHDLKINFSDTGVDLTVRLLDSVQKAVDLAGFNDDQLTRFVRMLAERNNLTEKQTESIRLYITEFRIMTPSERKIHVQTVASAHKLIHMAAEGKDENLLREAAGLLVEKGAIDEDLTDFFIDKIFHPSVTAPNPTGETALPIADIIAAFNDASKPAHFILDFIPHYIKLPDAGEAVLLTFRDDCDNLYASLPEGHYHIVPDDGPLLFTGESEKQFNPWNFLDKFAGLIREGKVKFNPKHFEFIPSRMHKFFSSVYIF